MLVDLLDEETREVGWEREGVVDVSWAVVEDCLLPPRIEGSSSEALPVVEEDLRRRDDDPLGSPLRVAWDRPHGDRVIRRRPEEPDPRDAEPAHEEGEERRELIALGDGRGLAWPRASLVGPGLPGARGARLLVRDRPGELPETAVSGRLEDELYAHVVELESSARLEPVLREEGPVVLLHRRRGREDRDGAAELVEQRADGDALEPGERSGRLRLSRCCRRRRLALCLRCALGRRRSRDRCGAHVGNPCAAPALTGSRAGEEQRGAEEDAQGAPRPEPSRRPPSAHLLQG